MFNQVEFCRPMRRGEESAVTQVLNKAFAGEGEAKLVEALRKSGQMAGEMVMPTQDGTIVGYYALSEMRQPQRWLSLAPVAVHPDWQGQGHGRRMIGQLSAWALAARQFVVVLGQVEFYTRAGFDQARAARLQSPYPVENTLLVGPGEDQPEDVLIYPTAFEGM